MSPLLIATILILYFAALLAISFYTSRNATSDTFFSGNKQSKWYLVAFGMIGTSLSGVTFISVPGTVGANGWYYFQLVLGFFIGYLVVAYVLLPLYYRSDVAVIPAQMKGYKLTGHQFPETNEVEKWTVE